MFGATAFGAGAGGPGVYLVMTSFVKPPQGESFGGAEVWLGLMVCGGFLGTAAGFSGALVCVTQRRGGTWGPAVWLGIAVGAAAGAAIIVFGFDRHHVWYRLMIAGFFVAGGGGAGGLLGAIATKMFGTRSRSTRGPAKRRTPLKPPPAGAPEP